MQRVWSIIRVKKQAGFTVVEVLLAATVFGLLVAALAGAIIYGRSSTASAGDRAQAIALAEEGLEAVRNIRDDDYTNLANGTYGLAVSGGQWVFSGSSDVTGIFTRQITIATVDGDRKTVTSTVTWATGSATRQVDAAMRLTDWQAAISAPVVPGPIMMVYSKTTATPYYRIWNGSTWGIELPAQAVVGNINYMVLKSSRTRNESILGVQTSTGAIYVQIWNGTSWGNLTQVGVGPAATRSFDIAYEKNSDRAIIAYTPTGGSSDFSYRTWNGTTLSSAVATTITPNLNGLNWIEMRQNPLSGSNEISMIVVDVAFGVSAFAWNGTTWGNMGDATVWDSSTASASKKSIDVEYEQTSGRAMFMWGDSVAGDQYYRIWNGTTLTAATKLTISTEGGAAEWVQLVARPNSNEIMLGVQDAGADLNTRKWSGSAWDTVTQHVEHSAATENIASRNFDIVWETSALNPGEAWLLWGDGAAVSKKQWSGTAWGTASTLTGSDDTAFLRLRADPVSGAIFAGIYEDSTSATDDIWESRLTGGGTTWTAKNSIWGGATSASPTYFRIDIATP